MTTAIDSINGNNGTLGDNAILDDFGRVVFDGSGAYVEIPDNNNYSVSTTGELTVSFWMRVDALNNEVTTASGDGPYVHIVGKSVYEPDSNHEWLFRIYDKDNGSTRPNRVSFYVFNQAGGLGVGSYFQGGISGTPYLALGEWVHVVGKVDSTYTYIYRNGSLRDQDDYTATITPENTPAPVRLGFVQYGTGDPGYFTGAIRDLRIYNRALSDAEVLQLFNRVDVTSGLVGKWAFNEQLLPIKEGPGGPGTRYINKNYPAVEGLIAGSTKQT